MGWCRLAESSWLCGSAVGKRRPAQTGADQCRPVPFSTSDLCALSAPGLPLTRTLILCRDVLQPFHHQPSFITSLHHLPWKPNNPFTILEGSLLALDADARVPPYYGSFMGAQELGHSINPHLIHFKPAGCEI